MINAVLAKVFGTKHERELKRMQPVVDQINALESEVKAFSDDDLERKTDEFRGRLENGETLDDLLVPAFTAAREAAWRALGMRPFDVQLIGGVVLHQGKIAEMKTGEGKTLVATLPAYLNALAGKGVHVVTVNDYLAKRDSEWMAPVFEALGMSVGVIQTNMPDAERQKAYAADITYGTNNEFGFDYLRDNMKFEFANMVQRPHYYAIVDEVDSILVDEARTPLIISGPSEESTDKYYRIDRIIPRFDRGEEHQDEDGVKYTTGDFLVDEKAHTVTLTDEGVAKAEELLGVENLYDLENMDLIHGINQGLRAHHLYKRDVAYLVKDDQVVIVDVFTGRMMPGRRWSDGLHQAVEAKEGVKIERENQTLATITFQNYFRMYEKLAGMTGTAETEEAEFGEIYDLDVSVIPTNRPLDRPDYPDVVYRTAREKWDAVVDEIRDCRERGQPALVGTISIENSEMLSKQLKRRQVPHVVLNAKFHGREASIVAQAGRKGAVTIATNMAGRGTDIVLGGNPEGLARAEADPEKDPGGYEEAMARYQKICVTERDEVIEAGGVHILGTERHESRRIDNQLRGRSGRQGDPGSSRFYISLEDDLMRIFGGGTDRVKNLMGRLGMEEGEAIEHKMVTKAIERAQTQVEARNFEVRKHLLKYDDVMNKQREALYQLRREVLEGKFSFQDEDHDFDEPTEEGTREFMMRISGDILDDAIANHCADAADPRDWNLSELATDVRSAFDIDVYKVGLDLEKLGIDELREQLWGAIESKYSGKEEQHGAEVLRTLERNIMLQILDGAWKDHLLALDHLKEGITLRSYGQKDPLNEYKRESFELFTDMKTRFEDSVVRNLYRVEPVSEEELAERRRRMVEQMKSRFRFSAPPKSASGQTKPQTVKRKDRKVGRNEPCPCGSGKKYKKCHGARQM
ncbi:MAG: preprotein translocase subunit SecA [bacterium]|nr:preprotein translocase subunit SecA [bacterium]